MSGLNPSSAREMTLPARIIFQGPYTFFGENSLFAAHQEEFPGVYLWCIDTGDRLLPYYVGMSRQVLSRTRQHIKAHMTGAYWVYDADRLAEARKDVLYKPMRADEALAIGPEFYAAARAQLERTRVVAARIDVDRPWLLRVESALILALAADPELVRIQDNGSVSKYTAESERISVPVTLPSVVALNVDELAI